MFRLIAQPLLHKSPNPTAIPHVRLSQIFANPRLDLNNVGERILRRLPHSVQLGKANAKTRIINVLIRNLFGRSNVRGLDDGRIDQQLEQRFTGERPALLVAVDEGLAIGEGFGERDDGDFAIERSDELLGVRKNDGRVDGSEDAGFKFSGWTTPKNCIGATYSC